ncbi:hypothetical protein [Kovacikia minuta]|uniref:hypothetical protein n=1 Tax=Kovacikia minuta TaxID=2931930 RepID=UPI0036F3DD3C
METILQHAQALVYSLLCLMPSADQKASLKALLGLFLDAQGHALPAHTSVKSASALSRFLNHYAWSTRSVIRTARQAILQQIATHLPHTKIPIRILIDLTTLEKSGKFRQLSTPTSEPNHPDLWVRVLNGKRGLHLVVLYLIVGEWRVPWNFRVWRGKGYTSPAQLGCKLLATVPQSLLKGRVVLVQADTEFGTVEFLQAVRKRSWRAVVGLRSNRTLQDGRSSKTFTGTPSGVSRWFSRTSIIPLPSPGFGSNEPMVNENCDLSPPPILILEPISSSWGASVGRLKAFSKLPSISLGCIVLVKAQS